MKEISEGPKTSQPTSPGGDFRPVLPPNRRLSWLRRLLACNPFYPVSAALLLYGCHRLAADPRFLNREIVHLCLNLASLQLYEALLVVTAILLAGRAIWYDSTLLVGLENMLVLVPFIFISQAALIDPRIVWTLSLCAGLLVVVRFSGLKRFIGRLNFPGRLQAIGLAVLAVNVALPVIYRVLHDSKFGTRPDWGAAYQMNQCAWWLLLPLFCALASVLSPARRPGELLPEHRLLPLGCFFLWLAGTVVHLYCLGYIYDFTLRADLVAPAAWMLAWMAHRRVTDLLPNLTPHWRRALWAPPLLATFLAGWAPDKKVFLILTAANIGIYAAISIVQRDRRLAVHLGLISVLALLGGLPAEWYPSLGAACSRARCLGAGVAVYCLLWSVVSRNPKLGLFGALVCTATVVSLLGSGANARHWAIQAGLAFLLMHSLRWSDAEHVGARMVRLLAGLVWMGHAFAWMRLGGAGWMVCAVAGPVLAAYLVARWVSGQWGPRVVPLASFVVLLSGPGDFTAGKVQAAPVGLLAILGSFLLFGLGTLAAITRQRWNKADR